MGNVPIVPVGITGPSRQGKSYTVSRLVGVAGGFPVSPSLQPCTHGIWMSPQAVKVQGKPHKLLFLDTESTATKEQSNQASTTFVALVGMVSSLLIMNEMHNLHEDNLGNLSTAAVVMKRLSSNTSTSAAPAYLEEQLRDLDLGDALDVTSVCAKNGMRGMIRSAFPRRTALFLPHPGPSRAADVEAAPDSALNPGFVQGLADLAQLVFTRAAPKTFRGVTLTGPLLISMLQGALQVANTPGGVLNIGSMWNSMLEAELARAAAAARKAYDKAARTMAACSSAEQAERMHKRIRRQEAERQLAYGELLGRAKEAGLEALDRKGLAQRLQGCSDQEEAKKLMQVNAAAAAKAFDTCLATWQGAVPGQQQAALAAAQHELAAVVKATHAVAEEQVAKARLEKERQLDDMQRAAMKAAVDKYKEAMGAMAQNSSSEAAVRSKHQAVLAELVASLPASLPRQRLADMQAELQQRCSELLGTGLLTVQLRKKSEDLTALAKAERAALAAFKSAVERRVPNDCTDALAACMSCQVCQSDAVKQFQQAAAKQSSYASSSPEHAMAMKQLEGAMDDWCNKLLDTVKRNAVRVAEIAELKAQTAAAKQETAEAQRARDAAASAAAEQLRIAPQMPWMCVPGYHAPQPRCPFPRGGSRCIEEELMIFATPTAGAAAAAAAAVLEPVQEGTLASL
ncbi:guanylate-binding protein [Scenedesmus sp. NREL 46B-D3]|nr:guanylate-binding protein [Scenedesmus sp. NREL 46B-D3]